MRRQPGQRRLWNLREHEVGLDFNELLTPAVNLRTVDSDIGRGVERQADLVPLDAHDRHSDVVVNNDVFADFAILVGDAPPHMDYPDDVKYPETCKEAVKRDIIINTVLCGSSASPKDHWLKICRLAEGSFVQIDADGGPVVAVATPFDKELAELSVKFTDSTLVYGSAEAKASAAFGLGGAGGVGGEGLPPAIAAPRAGFLARAGGTAHDLLKAIKDEKVKLEDVKKEELPKELAGKSLGEQKEILAKLDKEREALSKRVLELEKKRNEFIAKKVAEDTKLAAPTSFENEVLGILRVQARRSGIEYEAIAPKKK